MEKKEWMNSLFRQHGSPVCLFLYPLCLILFKNTEIFSNSWLFQEIGPHLSPCTSTAYFWLFQLLVMMIACCSFLQLYQKSKNVFTLDQNKPQFRLIWIHMTSFLLTKVWAVVWGRVSSLILLLGTEWKLRKSRLNGLHLKAPLKKNST